MIGVVGATPSGLATAYDLVRRGRDVRVFEPSDRIGGLEASYPSSSPPPSPSSAIEGDASPLERVPVAFARPRDEAALELLAELGLTDRLEWGAIRTALYVDGTVHPVDTSREFLAYPPLSLGDTARLATIRSGIDCRGPPRRRPRFGAYEPSDYADAPAEAFVREHAGDAAYDRFYGPLLEARFGSHAPTVSAAWVLEHSRGERERTRSGRERRGYLAGSEAALVEALVDEIGRERIETNAHVRTIETADGAVESTTVESGGTTERRAVDAVVVATALEDRDEVPEALAPLAGTPPLPTLTRTCLRVSTTAATPPTDADRVTFADDAPFGELVAPPVGRSVDGQGRCYYLLDGGRAAAEGLSPATVERRWLEALATLFDAFDRNDLAGVETTRIRQPVPDHALSSAESSLFEARPTGDGLPDGIYDATAVREPQFPQRRLGGALETGLRCATIVAESVQGTPDRRPVDRRG